MPSQQRGGQVGGTEDVEAAGEDAAGDAVEGGCVPGDLGLVDRQVRGDGTVEALGGEDGVGVGGFGGLGLRGGFRGGGLEGDVPAMRVSWIEDSKGCAHWEKGQKTWEML